MWDVARALVSRQVNCCRNRLREELWPGQWRGRGGAAASGASFSEAYPNCVLADGWSALAPGAFEHTKYAADIRDADEYGNTRSMHRGAKCPPLTLSRR